MQVPLPFYKAIANLIYDDGYTVVWLSFRGWQFKKFMAKEEALAFFKSLKVFKIFKYFI
jgi:hypothetical protein